MKRRRSGLRQLLIGAVLSVTAALIVTVALIEKPLSERRVRSAVTEELNAALDAYERERDTVAIAHRFGTRIEQVEGEASDRAQVRDDRYVLKRHIGDATVQASVPTRLAQVVRAGTSELLIVGALLAALLAFLLVRTLSRLVLEPAHNLTEVADRLAGGDLSARSRSERLDEFGEIGRAIDGVADQLTERINRLHAEEDALRTVLNSMAEAVFVTDSLGRIVQTNDALDRLVPDVLGKTSMEALRDEELSRSVRAGRRGEESAVELELMVRGARQVFEAQVAPLGDRAGVVTVLHDVTRLKRADEIRRDFVANASHELRTPLTAIRGYAETLKGSAGQQPETSARFLNIILKHTLRLQRLVDDLVALSRAESPEEHTTLVSVDVARCAQDVVAGLEKRALDRGLTIEVVEHDTHEALVDERALDQVLINLVANAIKYTPEKGAVRIEVSEDDAHVSIAVFNTATIEEKHLDRIFERFYRVDEGRSREEGGTGLGLAIVRHQVLRMNGTVSVASDDDGTTFLVKVPRATI